MSATGRGARRKRLDYYPTPDWAIDAILPHLPLWPDCVIDAGAGEGGITGRLLTKYSAGRVAAVEVDPRRAAICQERHSEVVVYTADFLAQPWTWASLFVMNPPYAEGLAETFVSHALAQGDVEVFALLRLGFLESRGRVAFHREHPADIFVLPTRPSFTGKGTDATAYGWFAWGGDHRGGRWTVLGPPPESKKRKGVAPCT